MSGIQNIQKTESNNNRYKLINIIIIILTTALILLSISIIILINLNDNNVDKYLNRVVEIKAVVNENEIYGSGTIIDNGFIITSAHVVTYKEEDNIIECKEIYSRSPLENEFIKCDLIEYDYKLDIAKLQANIDTKGFKLKNRKYKDAEEVYAIGNAMNYGISITKGIISRKEVKIEYHDNLSSFIQVDINSSNGSSGGALINKKGDLIGIITFRSKDNSSNINYGYLFCIPIGVLIEYVN